jgi:hypothetical protein
VRQWPLKNSISRQTSVVLSAAAAAAAAAVSRLLPTESGQRPFSQNLIAAAAAAADAAAARGDRQTRKKGKNIYRINLHHPHHIVPHFANASTTALRKSIKTNIHSVSHLQAWPSCIRHLGDLGGKKKEGMADIYVDIYIQTDCMGGVRDDEEGKRGREGGEFTDRWFHDEMGEVWQIK